MFKKIILYFLGFLFCLGLLARCNVIAQSKDKDAEAKKVAVEHKAKGTEGELKQIHEFLQKGK